MKLYCVVGMHRSGTSAVSRTLNLLGVGLGPEDELLDPDDDNPSGFWENRQVLKLHDDVLAHLGGSWHEPAFHDDGWQTADDLAPFRERAARIIETVLVGDGPVAWKDPRGALLLPLWQEVTPIAGVVLVIRHPMEVAASLEKRDGIEAGPAAHLWLRHIVAAWRAAPDHHLVHHADLVSRPRDVATGLASFVDRPADEDALARIDDYIIRHDPHAAPDWGDVPLMRVASALHQLIVTGQRGIVGPFVDVLHDRFKSIELLETLARDATNLLPQLRPR